jgi:mannobiose 2-epimerase
MSRFLFFLLLLAILLSCGTKQTGSSSAKAHWEERAALADTLEESLFKFILDAWYPRVIDSVNGGYHSNFNHDWSFAEGSQERALVQQARHLWTTSLVYEKYPQREEYLDYAGKGFHFLKNSMWDERFGGFHTYVTPEGKEVPRTLDDKRIYGQAFAVYGLSQYYRASENPEALSLARNAFLWMEKHAHDKEYGGYFDVLHRDGRPVRPEESTLLTAGLKDYNSSIHLLEAFTELYHIWPDTLVRKRLEEMFYLVRDTFVHPEGYLRLYYQADWTHVSDEDVKSSQDRHDWYFEHFTYGHDVETAFLLLEAAHTLGWGEEKRTHHIAKKLVDHSLASGWDREKGGFYDAGLEGEKGIRIVNDRKSWWSLVEGMNALMLMHTLYPEDAQDYYGLFLTSWNHIDNYLIDKTYGGWYNAATDTYPETLKQPKSHIWKTTYHNARGMIHCIEMLRSAKHKPN